MKKILTSLPAKLLIGIIVGIIIGLVAPEKVMVVLVPIKNILGQLINFIVPLIVIGFIAPSITKLGNNATRMLGVAIVLHTAHQYSQHSFLWVQDMQSFLIYHLAIQQI